MPTRRLEVEIVGDSKGLSRTFAQASKDTDTFGKKIGRGLAVSAKAGGLAVAAAGAVAAVGLKKSLDAAADFEQTLNVFKATAGATAGQMKSVSAAALALGRDAKLPATSAKDAAVAMTELAKGGLNVKQSMNAARGVLQLSAAAQISNADAATITADSLNAFALKGKDAVRVADLLAASANATTASIPEMGLALKQVSASAHQLGIPIQDVTTALGELANAGVKGSDAGTSVKTMLQFLQPKSVAAANAMKDLGVHVFDAQGKFVGLRGVVKQYHDALGPLTQEQKQQAITTIFGSDAARAANIVLAQGTTSFDRMRDAVTKHGAAQKLAEAQTQGYKGAMMALSSELETLQIEIGMRLLPVATQFAKWITNSALPALERFIPTIANLIGRVTEFANGLFHATQTLNPLTGQVTTTASAFDRMRASVENTLAPFREHATLIKQAGAAVLVGVVAFKAITTAIKVATAAQLLFDAALTANPVGVVIVAIAGLAAGLTLLYQRSQTAHKLIDEAFAGIKTAVANVVPVFDTVKNAVATATATARALWGKFGADITKITKTFLAAVLSVVRPQMEAIRAIIAAILAVIRGDWGAAWADLKTAMVKTLQAAVASIRGMISLFVVVMQTLGARALQALWGEIQHIPGYFKQALAAAPGAIAAAGGAAVAAARQLGIAIATGIAAGVRDAAGSVAGAVGGVASGALDHARKLLHIGSPSRVFADQVGKPIVQGIAAGITDNQRLLSGAIGDTVRKAITDAKQNLLGLGDTFSSTIGQAIDAQAQNALDALDQSDAAKRIRDIDDQLTAEQRARDRSDIGEAISRANEAIRGATTVEDRHQAESDLEQATIRLHEWQLEEEKRVNQATLDQRRQQITDEAKARKQAADQGLSDLITNLNAGLLSQQQFNDQLQAILAASGVNYEALGGLLGSSFARGYLAQLQGLKAQADAILTGPQAPGAGLAPDIISPGAVAASADAAATAKARAAAAAAVKHLGLTGFTQTGHFATGGIVNRPTLALVGEAGREAIVPLDRPSAVGSMLSPTVNIFNTNGLDEGALASRIAWKLKTAV